MNRPALIACFFTILGLLVPNNSLADASATARIRALQANTKLNVPAPALEDLAVDGAAIRVIVNMRDPQAGYATTMNAGKQRSVMVSRPARQLRAASVRRQLREDVRAMQQRVINTAGVPASHVTNQFNYIYGFAAEASAEELKALADHPDVLSIEEDAILEPLMAQGIPLMNASVITDQYNGEGMAIAICDTGIDYTHPMLGGGAFPNDKVIGGYDIGQNDPDPMDGHGHGTSCAGIAAGSLGNVGDYIGGVAYNAKLYALKISNSATGGSSNTSDMVAAWEWCITHQNDDPDNPILVISTSFGGGHFSDQTACEGYVTAMTTAAANAKDVGITIVAAAGNDGYCDGLAWPACLNDVISVGAVYDAAVGTFSWCVSADSCAAKTASESCSSGYYTTDIAVPDGVAAYSNSAPFLSLLAPSNATTTTDLGGGYTTYQSGFGGTSAACPYAAGAAAALQSVAKARTGAYLTPDEIKSFLSDYGDPVTDPKSGLTKPRINLKAAADAMASYPLLSTDEVSNVTTNSATGGGSVTDDGGGAVTARGICWRPASDDTAQEQCTQDGTGTGSFTNVMSQLQAGVTYQVRAYATNNIATSYGETRTFTTLPAFKTASFSGGGGGGGGGCFVDTVLGF